MKRMYDYEWPMHRHNSCRTGRTSGLGNIKQPLIVGRQKTTSLSKVEMWIEDLNTDGQDEYIFIEGGRIQVKNHNGGVLWRSDICNPLIIGFHDMDGSGIEKCVVAVANLRTLIVL